MRALLSASVLFGSAWGFETRAAAAEATAVHYFIPVEAPTGQVHVLSFGLAELPLAGPRHLRRFVHVRLAGENREDDTPWTLDARAQALVLPGGRRVAPGFAEASPGVVPAVITLRRGQRGYLDLFFPMTDPHDPPWTALAWVIRRAGFVTVASTVFRRLSNGDAEYEYYDPWHHVGGSVIVGASWCFPGAWHSGWLHHYAGYDGYRQHRHQGGAGVTGERLTDRGSERPASVGRAWRDAAGASARWNAPPAPATPAPPPSSDSSASSSSESSSSSGHGSSGSSSESVGSHWRALR